MIIRSAAIPAAFNPSAYYPMANIELKVPSPGESISEVRIAQWLVADGDVVKKDQVVAEIDSDKATLELIAEEGGKISLLAEADATVNVGDVVAKIDTSVKPAAEGKTEGTEKKGEVKEEKKEKKENKKEKEEKKEGGEGQKNEP